MLIECSESELSDVLTQNSLVGGSKAVNTLLRAWFTLFSESPRSSIAPGRVLWLRWRLAMVASLRGIVDRRLSLYLGISWYCTIRQNRNLKKFAKKLYNKIAVIQRQRISKFLCQIFTFVKDRDNIKYNDKINFGTSNFGYKHIPLSIWTIDLI